MDITEIRSKSLGRSFLQRTVRPVPKLWLQNWHHKITTKDYILNCELHFTQSYHYYKLKNIVLWICSKVHNVKIMMMMMMMIMMMTTTTKTTTMMMMITITVYYYYYYYYYFFNHPISSSICKLPIRSNIYNCTFNNTNKVSIIIINFIVRWSIIFSLLQHQKRKQRRITQAP